MHVRTGHVSGINLLLDFEIGIGLNGTSGANGRHARRQVQPRKTVCHIGEGRRRDRIEQVFVHSHQPGHYAVAVQIEHLCVLGKICPRSVAHRLNFSLAEDNRLIFTRGCARPVNDPDVSQRNDRRVDLHEIPDFWRKRLSRCTADHQ